MKHILLGGLIALLANAYFAFKAFRYFGARSARAIVQSIWAGAMGKWIITAVLFALTKKIDSKRGPMAPSCFG